ncbi:MAG TPA: SOS response-associated peptidase family protein [Devosia sp.]|nr:SOS response-associated peptidase family protein [Devosia sp.]
MCGRFTNEMTWEQIHALYKLSDNLYPVKSNLQPRYNIAPTQDVMFVHLDKETSSSTKAVDGWCPGSPRSCPRPPSSKPGSKRSTPRAPSGRASSPAAA